MSEGYNYQLLTAIVKILNPKGKPVVGVADGQGKFMWLPTEKIILSHPMQYTMWQTTIFAITPDWKLIWKDELNFEQYKSTYSNTIPIIQPIPPMLLGAPAQTTTTTQPTNSPPQTQTAPQRIHDSSLQPQQQYITPISGSAVTPHMSSDYYLENIANELRMIRQLLELYIKPPNLTTAEQIASEMSQEQIIDEYGEPPMLDDDELDEFGINSNVNINKDELPDIF